MVEQEAVNFEVAGSSPASRAKYRTKITEVNSLCYFYWVDTATDFESSDY